jgi:hypothetical protein
MADLVNTFHLFMFRMLNLFRTPMFVKIIVIITYENS